MSKQDLFNEINKITKNELSKDEIEKFIIKLETEYKQQDYYPLRARIGDFTISEEFTLKDMIKDKFLGDYHSLPFGGVVTFAITNTLNIPYGIVEFLIGNGDGRDILFELIDDDEMEKIVNHVIMYSCVIEMIERIFDTKYLDSFEYGDIELHIFKDM